MFQGLFITDLLFHSDYFPPNDCILLFGLLFVEIMKHVVQDQVITVLVFRLQL